MKIVKQLPIYLIVMLMSVFVAACGGDDKDEPSATVGKLNITNNSTYTLSDFVVNFTNDSGEVITREQKGTVKPNDKVSVDIPIGATKYYMGTSLYGTRFWSADYAVSVKKQVLTDQIVGNWSSN